jgi:hypothetical protein
VDETIVYQALLWAGVLIVLCAFCGLFTAQRPVTLLIPFAVSSVVCSAIYWVAGADDDKLPVAAVLGATVAALIGIASYVRRPDQGLFAAISWSLLGTVTLPAAFFLFLLAACPDEGCFS